MRFRAKLEQQLNAIWYPVAGSNKLSSPLDYFIYYYIKFFLFLISPFVWIIRLFYKSKANIDSPLNFDINLLDQKLLIIIGNITVGGTGKTPIVAKLYEHLSQLGYTPGIISKGYLGCKVSAEPHRVQPQDNPKEWGDEPVLLANRLKDCPIVVCNSRLKAIAGLLTHNPNINIILTDDGLQDKYLAQLASALNKKQVIKIAVIDSQRGLGNEKLLPEGPLRQSKNTLSTVDYLMIHESTGSMEHASINQLPNIETKGIWLRSQIIGFEQLNTNLNFTPLQFAKAFHKIRAISGIGHPERFFQNLMYLGLSVKSTAYPDHFDFQEADLQFEDTLPIVITEKDAVKIKAFSQNIKTPIWVAKLDITGIEGLTDKIQAICFSMYRGT